MRFFDKYYDRFSNKSLLFLKVLGYLGSIGASVLLLLNLLVGIIEPIPDLIPVIGNLDEIGEVLLILWAWPRLIKSIEEFQQPEPVSEELQVEDIEYIDVRAEVLTSPDAQQTEKESTTEYDRTDTGKSDEPS